MHGYPDLPPGPGCRLPPPPHPGPPPPELLYPPHPDLLGPGHPHPGDGCGDDYQPPHPPPDLCGEPGSEFGYLDTSDDSGRHTGPDPASP